MKRLALALIFAATTAAAQQPPAGPAAPAAPATRWPAELAAYDAQDKASPPPLGEIVFVGSSSIKVWDLAKSFPDLKTINRGIISSSIADAVRDVEPLVLRYQPRIVVLYAGDNDINGGALAEQVAVQFEHFVRAVHEKLPETKIVFIGIKPSPDRWDVIERTRLANSLIRADVAHDDRLAFVDVDNAMLGWDEKPRPELYTPDGLHLTAAAYELWAALLRPLLAPPHAPGR